MNSVWKLTLGTPEPFTPVSVLKIAPDTRAMDALASVAENPLSFRDIGFFRTARGCNLTIPVRENELFFGTGLQLKSVNQTGKKKHLRVNSDPVADTGDSHAPVPFYVSSLGYGLLVDTARYASFYFATHSANNTHPQKRERENSHSPADNTEQLYAAGKKDGELRVVIDIPAASGVDLYVFGGPDMLTAVQRYNLFSGGGVLPPLWGLGMWYRGYTRAAEADILQQSEMFRRDRLPCDVFGLEPGWQTHAYSCTYRWNTENFPHPQAMLDKLIGDGFHINLWEHIFIDEQSDLYGPLTEYAGDYRVWDGIVPDYSIPDAAEMYVNHHKSELVDKGVSGFKLDECDNSDFIAAPWSFPEASRFPSGLDGEQMHCLLGSLYMKANQRTLDLSGLRTYGCVRSAGALAAGFSYVLYSDLYDARDFVRGMVSAGYCGLLWTPEVRQCDSAADLIRRVQAVIMSPMAQINAWMIPHPPWKQYDCDKNIEGVLLPEQQQLTDKCRELFRLRMSLVPYFYAAFYEYKTVGKPPFRALPLDYPDDAHVYDIEDSYIIGNDLLFAPVFPEQIEREVYLPAGGWYDYFTCEFFPGGQTYKLDTDNYRMLLFVRAGSLIPVAEPVMYIDKDTVFEITLKKFGSGNARCRLIEDDGESLAYMNGEQNRIDILWADGNDPVSCAEGGYTGRRYRFCEKLEIGVR